MDPTQYQPRRYPVTLDLETQVKLPQTQELLQAVKTVLDPENRSLISLNLHTRLSQEELNRLNGNLSLSEVYCHRGSDEHGWTIDIRAEDLLDCERANSAQIIAIQALSQDHPRPRDYDTISPRALDFLAELSDNANGDEFHISPELVQSAATRHGITIDDLAIPHYQR